MEDLDDSLVLYNKDDSKRKSKMGITVLSLFDGMSVGRCALKELGIKVDKYYASEIDKHVIAQTQKNFPDTIQLGSVTDIDARKLGHIDLLIGGSPCTDLSMAGTRRGLSTVDKQEILSLEQYMQLKSDGFQFAGESFLFWEYVRIRKELLEMNPNLLWFLENVEMGAKWETVFNSIMGISGIHMNSALVSAQNRRRIYWTNIQVKEVGFLRMKVANIPQPEDRGITLADVLEDEVDGKYYLKDDVVDKLLANGVKGA